jgi:hypothetical protein
MVTPRVIVLDWFKSWKGSNTAPSPPDSLGSKDASTNPMFSLPDAPSSIWIRELTAFLFLSSIEGPLPVSVFSKRSERV